jgi:hypothetical protein
MAKRQTSALLSKGGRGIPESRWLIAHDLRNDLAAALLRLRILERCEPEEQVRAAANLVLAAIDRLEEQEADPRSIRGCRVGPTLSPAPGLVGGLPPERRRAP